jgi:transcription elongation factor/antiterminator RfaH
MARADWYALYVKSRHEFVVSNELQRKGIDTFLPSIQKLSQWKDRKKPIQVPLFPGYLFVHITPDPEAFSRVRKTRGIVTFVSSTTGCPTPAAPEEIHALKIMLDSGDIVDIYPHLKEGAPVRMRKGIFQGAEGILEKKDDQCVFIVSIKLLGKSVGVRICADEVEAA